MSLPTEPIGSIPRPKEFLAAITAHAAGRVSEEQFHGAEEAALRDIISRFEHTGSPVIADGEQSKSSFATYPLAGLSKLAPDGVIIPFAAHAATPSADCRTFSIMACMPLPSCGQPVAIPSGR